MTFKTDGDGLHEARMSLTKKPSGRCGPGLMRASQCGQFGAAINPFDKIVSNDMLRTNSLTLLAHSDPVFTPADSFL